MKRHEGIVKGYDPGKMTQRVTFKSVTASMGDGNKTEATLGTVWGHIRPVAGGERELAGGEKHIEVYALEISYKESFYDTSHVVEALGGKFEITALRRDLVNFLAIYTLSRIK
jgi:head-tail adaptor